MDRETELLLRTISSDLHELKELNKDVVELIKEHSLLKQEMMNSNRKHDEGRKVLHKRFDSVEKAWQKRFETFQKIFFWVGSTIFLAMGTIIMSLVEKIF